MHNVIKASWIFNFINLYNEPIYKHTAATTQRMKEYDRVGSNCQDILGLHHQMALLNCSKKYQHYGEELWTIETYVVRGGLL